MKSSPSLVAQIFNLLYRRFSFCGSLENFQRPPAKTALPIANRRYSRLKTCATVALLLAAASLRAHLVAAAHQPAVEKHVRRRQDRGAVHVVLGLAVRLVPDAHGTH